MRAGWRILGLLGRLAAVCAQAVLPKGNWSPLCVSLRRSVCREVQLEALTVGFVLCTPPRVRAGNAGNARVALVVLWTCLFLRLNAGRRYDVWWCGQDC